MTEQKLPLYQTIVKDIEDRLHSGEFTGGDKLYSIGELKKYYNVSATTAVRAIEELKEKELICSIKGKGCFFRGSPQISGILHENEDLKEIVIITTVMRKDRTDFNSKIIEGIKSAADGIGVNSHIKVVPHTEATGMHRLPFKPKASEGIILVGSAMSVGLYPVLKSSRVRTVVVDTVLSGVNCVATDNFDGIHKLIVCLKNLGHTSFLMSAYHSSSPNPANENERIEAFRFFTEQYNLKSKIVEGDQHEEILRLLKGRNRPTAVMFTQDEPALDFIGEAEEAGFKIPDDISITGFDKYSSSRRSVEKLTTIDVNRIEMGKAAVRLLLSSDSRKNYIKPWARVRGSLSVKNSISSCELETGHAVSYT
ncbi:MAG: GntR family transcriptional regulator [Planctomycetota bacterium]|jgi:DNA-binding LacI/PurR family transcriptional regulator